MSPNAHIASIVAGRGLNGLLDPDLGRLAYEPSYDLGIQCAERFRSRNARAIEELAAA